MRHHFILSLSLVAACGTPIGAEVPASTTQSSDWSVVGGALETRFPAVGYLMSAKGNKPLAGPNCGATLVAPKVAITAAHCVWNDEATRFGMGFGNVYSGPPNPGQVFMHPEYRRRDPKHRYRHDFAVLVLDEAVTDVAPMPRATAATGGEALYVGYGRTSVGDQKVTTGYTGERKSTAESITKIDATNLWTTGVGGGLCWGDSGGPIIDADFGTVYGVLADFDTNFYCNIGNKMIFSSVDGNADLLDRAISCANSADVQACMSVGCKYSCKDYGYAMSECKDGWRCDGACLQYIGDCK